MRTLLIANRGEIALRVMRTAARMGIRTVAVHTDADASAPHVRAADEAVRIGSYLDVDEVVAAAVSSGADAVHPGYGFLSERAAFATALDAAGVRLVGPSAAVMEQMGRKDLAREVAVAAGVPVVPHHDLDERSAIGYPVLVKAAAGGGGKGMRVVRSAADLDEAVAAARREAVTAFGDDTLLVERYVERGRHIEVQVLGDAHGHVVHLFERDCSSQRRHQKVLEEAPAPTITEAVRTLVTSAAVALARQVGYEGAGTVEFLLDEATGEAYFLEMNTRLQVEHPVTEAAVRIAGRQPDLVELQLRVAAGEPLPFDQEAVAIGGHAIEARVYAEDAFGGFLPQAGTAGLVRWPVATPGPGPTTVRVDHALESRQVVSTAYDPMLGKVIASGPDRESARRALVAALDATAITGLTTNTGFLRALVASEEFRDAAVDTAWLDRNPLPAPDPDEARLVAAWTSASLLAPEATGEAHPFQADGWRLAGPPAPVLVELDRPVLVDRVAGTVDGVPVTAVGAAGQPADHPAGHAADHVVVLQVAGRRRRAVVDVQAHTVEVVLDGQRHVFTRPDVLTDTGADLGDGTVPAPMPGTVLDVRVAAGQVVAGGEVLGVMEAMKMEITLTAPYDGTVTAVEAVVGGQVPLGARLFEVTGTERS